MNVPPTSPAGVAEALPTDVAGRPQSFKIPHQGLPPVLIGVAHGGQVRLNSGAHWHGKEVKLYYTPATNVSHQGDHYELVSANRVQYLTKARIQADGTWHTVWYNGQYRIPKHRPFFIMAKSDGGEIGLVHVNTIN